MFLRFPMIQSSNNFFLVSTAAMWGAGANAAHAAQFLAVAPGPAQNGRRSAPPEASIVAGLQPIRFQINNAEREHPQLSVPLPSNDGTTDSPNVSPGRRGAAGGETLSPRQPFLMPNMDPLVRQQGLLFQQSELLREQFMKFAEALQRLHSSVEELRDDLQAEHQQRLHSEENMASMVASLRTEVRDQIEEKMALLREEVSMRSRSSEAEVQRLGSCLDTVSQHLSEQIMGMSEGQLKMADNLAAKIAAVEDSFGSSMATKAALEDLRQKLEKQLQEVKESGDSTLRVHEAALLEEICRIRSDAILEAEEWSQRVAKVEKASQKLCTEMANEHQQTRISAVGLATELNELREALSKESQSYQESTTSVQRWVSETMALKQALQDEEIAQAALTQSVAENKQELDKQVALQKSLAEATAEYKSGKEELWQAMSSVEESNKQTVKDVESLRLRTQHMEVQRLGQVTRQLEELTAQQGDTVGKLDRVEQAQSSGQKSVSAKLEHQMSELKQAQTMLTQLSEQSTSHEFIESKDHQYRLCVTMDGDIGIFRRSGWGKHGSEFGAVPRWHAGAVGDKALCSVNRETQSYEKDRFLALANREQR